MNRFFVRPEDCLTDRVLLPASECHHAAVVLRLEPGAAVELLDGAGGRHSAVIEEASKRQVTVRITVRHPVLGRTAEVWLLMALTKGKSWDWMLQKATELGVAKIIPLRCERSVVRLGDGESEAKLADWRRTAAEAAKQCGTPWLPEIHESITVARALETGRRPDLALVAAFGNEARELGVWMAGMRPATVAVAVGPEGDFTPTELDLLAAGGFRPLTLGPLVLRAETAALAAAALVQYALRTGGG